MDERQDLTAQAGGTSWRDRYNAFIERHDVAWELVMAAIVVAWVVVGFTALESGVALTIESILTLILAAEFASRLYASHDRRAYLRAHWIDLVALIPFPEVRGLRVIRLLRLLRLVRAFTGIYRALVSIERFAADRTLVWLFMSWLGVMIISASAFYLAEVDVNPGIDDPGDALWWGIVTLTTVGYGDISALTHEGRIAAMALQLIGITLFAAVTATITSRFILHDGVRSESAGDQLREMAALHAEGILTQEEYFAKKADLLERI